MLGEEGAYLLFHSLPTSLAFYHRHGGNVFTFHVAQFSDFFLGSFEPMKLRPRFPHLTQMFSGTTRSST